MSDFNNWVKKEEKKIKDLFDKKNQQKYKSLGFLEKINNFWNKVKWYLVILLLLVVLMIYYNKEKLGSVSMAVVLVMAFLFIIIVFAFNDSKGPYANSLPFGTYPMPPHLGLNGVSNEVRFVN